NYFDHVATAMGMTWRILNIRVRAAAICREILTQLHNLVCQGLAQLTSIAREYPALAANYAALCCRYLLCRMLRSAALRYCNPPSSHVLRTLKHQLNPLHHRGFHVASFKTFG